MPTRDDLLAMVRAGASYEEIGRRFGVHPGQAYMIVTGLPADGGDVLEAEALARREGLLEGSSQHLANPPADVPTRDETVAEWMRGRATADRPMREAAARRPVRPPEPAYAEESDDVLSVLARQHNQLRVLQEQLETLGGSGGSARDRDRRAAVVDLLRTRLARHEEAEEEHFWPEVERTLPDGRDLSDTGREQEGEAKEICDALATACGDDDRFGDLVTRLLPALRRHLAFEETVFLRLGRATTEEQRAEIGRRVAAAASPHGPGRPSGPPADHPEPGERT